MEETAVNRTKPMRRTGFRRPPPREATQSTYTPTPRAPAFSFFVPLPAAPLHKREYVRSPELLLACRLIPCQHCGADDGTVCAAHSNWAAHGKGKSIKADDNRVASLCARCHVPLLDQGSELSRAERITLWWAAHVRTVRELLQRRLWPATVPVPDLTVGITVPEPST